TKLSIIIKNKPQYFIGSQLRGALGYALKKVTCINPSYTCDGCFAVSNCLYHEFYEEKNTFHKYRFDFELGREFYNFDFYLFDSATAKLPYIVSAFHMLLTQIGLGKEKKTYSKFDMYINDENCFSDGKLKLPQNFIKTFTIDNFYPNISLRFATPLRIKKENVFLRSDEIGLDELVNSIYQRQMRLLGKEYKKFPYPIIGEIVSKELHFKELSRYSNRQKTDMKLGGIIGEMKLKNLNIETYNILKVGELIGVGKSTVFGLGKIKIKPELGGRCE
ncbi:MAG: CRISPR system precrRNA processing endoribonuclease RAMP protein Cas6, partial [Arcobacteraceae bacterium]